MNVITNQETYYVVSNPYQGKGELFTLFAGHSQTYPEHQVGPKVYDYYLIHYIESGKGLFTCRDQTFELGQGASFLIEPGELTTYRSDDEEPWRYRWLAFNGKEAAELLGYEGGAGGHPDPVIQDKRLDIGQWIEAIQSTFQERAASGGLRATGFLYLILSALREAMFPDVRQEAEPLSKIEAHVRQVVQMLTTQYAEPISIEQLADSLGYNRAYFSKMFKHYVHVSPVTFLLNMRIGKARQLLRERTELTIEQIAYSVGFNDPLYFSKQFKRFYGLAPSAYRKSVEHLKKS